MFSGDYSYQIVRNKAIEFMAKIKTDLSGFDVIKVGSCFNEPEVKELAELMRTNYSSCLWKKGDIMLIEPQSDGCRDAWNGAASYSRHYW